LVNSCSNMLDATPDEKGVIDELQKEVKELRAQNRELLATIALLRNAEGGTEKITASQEQDNAKVRLEAKVASKRETRVAKRKQAQESLELEVSPNTKKRKLVQNSSSRGISEDRLSCSTLACSPNQSQKTRLSKSRKIKQERKSKTMKKTSPKISTKRTKPSPRSARTKKKPDPEKAVLVTKPPSHNKPITKKGKTAGEDEDEKQEFESLQQVQPAMEGHCTLCGQDYCDCSEEMDFNLSAEESEQEEFVPPNTNFTCEMCSYKTSKKEYYMNHVKNCNFSIGAKRETIAQAENEEDLWKDLKNNEWKDLKNNQNNPTTMPRYKSVMCKWFVANGFCTKGDACTFRHGEEDKGACNKNKQFPKHQPQQRAQQRNHPWQRSQQICFDPVQGRQQAVAQGRQQDLSFLPHQPTRVTYPEESFPSPGVVYLSGIHPKATSNSVLGALRSHLGGTHVKLSNRVEVSNRCAVVSFEDPELANKLLNSLPFMVFQKEVAVSADGVTSSSGSSIRQQVRLENWPSNSNFRAPRNSPNLVEQGVVYISNIPLRVTNKGVLGALRKHLGGEHVAVSNRIVVKGGHTTVRFKDPKIADKLMNSLPLQIFEHYVEVTNIRPRQDLVTEYRDDQQWSVGVRGVPDRRLNRRTINPFGNV